MKIYLVGGAVRDTLLHQPVTERDWVVVGASPQQMLDLGYQQVGKDFPVFLHPKSKEEYALARTERKSGAGYTGFTCYAAPDVTLEQDLIRRDLTVNAMAMDDQGNIVDPYNGQEDIANKTLRHVSAAFSEDPLRVLRVARFAARYHHLGFKVAEETLELMRDIASSGELNALTAERVWKEVSRVLVGNDAQVFFKVLRSCDALSALMPELDLLWHRQIRLADEAQTHLGAQSLEILTAASRLSESIDVRFSALTSSLNATSTPTSVESICLRMKVPKDIALMAQLVANHHQHLLDINNTSAEQVISILDDIDIWRRPERLSIFLLSCQACIQVQLADERLARKQTEIFRQMAEASLAVKVQDVIADGFKHAGIRQELSKRRVTAIQDLS